MSGVYVFEIGDWSHKNRFVDQFLCIFWTLIKMSRGFFLPRRRRNRVPKKPRRPSEQQRTHTHTHIQSPTVTLSSLSHIQILYIICHIHSDDHG